MNLIMIWKVSLIFSAIKKNVDHFYILKILIMLYVPLGLTITHLGEGPTMHEKIVDPSSARILSTKIVNFD